MTLTISNPRAYVLALALALSATANAYADEPMTHDDLISLFKEWRALESPRLSDGVPDYTDDAVNEQRKELKKLQKRLGAFDIDDWPVSKQVDYHIVRAEMNGLDFNIRVLKPWARDPAFYQQAWTYQSDTPAHEGPTNHALIELWTYDFPLSAEAAEKLTSELKTVRPLLAQARENLDGDARDLWISGTHTMKQQAQKIASLSMKVAGAGEDLKAAVSDARAATLEFVEWLEAEAPSKKGPSGIGKDNYTWRLQNVHLVPMTWEDEVMLLKRELRRAHASLRLEEHRNRALPELEPVASQQEYYALARASVDKYMRFIETQEILPMKDYLKPALLAQMGSYAPPAARNFFLQATHREPMTLYTHFYHWWDLARMAEEPMDNPIRQGPLLYNIFDSRAEGMATAMEEMMMHAGLYDDNPRAREIVWIMQAQRAARGLASLYAHANDFTMKDASDFHVKWTPRGWMSPDLELLGFEQQLYLRQPGYGTSYVTGKHLIEQLFADRMRQMLEERGEDYSVSDFFGDMNAAGVIPVSLIRWELTGDRSDIDMLEAGTDR
ncbi:MAG: hypothetical protein AAFX08_06640 [Pseudomonadota bacterium]